MAAKTRTSTAVSHQAESNSRPGPKMTACHMIEVTNWAIMRPMARRFDGWFDCESRAKANACNAHRLNQAKGNAQSGGIQLGLMSDLKKVTAEL